MKFLTDLETRLDSNSNPPPTRGKSTSAEGNVIPGPWQRPKKARRRKDVLLQFGLTSDEIRLVENYKAAFWDGCSGTAVERSKENWPATCLDWWFDDRHPSRFGYSLGAALSPVSSRRGATISVIVPPATYEVYERLLRERYVVDDDFTMADLAKLALLTFSDFRKRIDQTAAAR